MFNNLKKKKLLESLGVNKVADTSAPNDKAWLTAKSLNDKKAVVNNPPKSFPGTTMNGNNVKEAVEEAKEKKTQGIVFQKEHNTLGQDTKSEADEDKKKKMLSSLFKGKK
jgi:hypothetical protein